MEVPCKQLEAIVVALYDQVYVDVKEPWVVRVHKMSNSRVRLVLRDCFLDCYARACVNHQGS